MRKTLFRFTTLLVLTSLLGLGCKGGSEEAQTRMKPITLTYWRVFDDASDFRPILEEYAQSHPNVRIVYKKFRPEEYEKELLEAFAEDRGPDIFSIHNTWIGAYEKKITPMPKTIEVPIVRMEGTLKKEPKVIIEKKNTPTPKVMKDLFLDVVVKDVIREVPITAQGNKFDKRVLGLPYFVDTMVLFYNNDLLAQAGIAQPPNNWTEIQNSVKPLTRIGANDLILQAAIPLGTANNINRSPDVISLLMMQNGAKMTDDFGRATFDRMPPELADKREVVPGIEALTYYTEFANPLEPVYTWNARMPESFEAFADGKTAFFLGYNYHIPLLTTRAPKLNYSIRTVPQLNERSVNYASYWVETVSKKTKNPNEAWDFLLFASQKDQVKKYLEKTKRPTALLSLVDEQKKDPVLEPFAKQLLTAASWYRGKDSAAMETIMKDMIEEALANAPIDPKQAFRNAMSRAISRINQTLE